MGGNLSQTLDLGLENRDPKSLQQTSDRIKSVEFVLIQKICGARNPDLGLAYLVNTNETFQIDENDKEYLDDVSSYGRATPVGLNQIDTNRKQNPDKSPFDVKKAIKEQIEESDNHVLSSLISENQSRDVKVFNNSRFKNDILNAKKEQDEEKTENFFENDNTTKHAISKFDMSHPSQSRFNAFAIEPRDISQEQKRTSRLPQMAQAPDLLEEGKKSVPLHPNNPVPIDNNENILTSMMLDNNKSERLPNPQADATTQENVMLARKKTLGQTEKFVNPLIDLDTDPAPAQQVESEMDNSLHHEAKDPHTPKTPIHPFTKSKLVSSKTPFEPAFDRPSEDSFAELEKLKVSALQRLPPSEEANADNISNMALKPEDSYSMSCSIHPDDSLGGTDIQDQAVRREAFKKKILDSLSPEKTPRDSNSKTGVPINVLKDLKSDTQRDK